MQAKISSKGQIVLPSPIRRKLGLHAGDPLEATIEGDRIVLTRSAPPVQEARIGIDTLTGLPVLKVGTTARSTSRRGSKPRARPSTVISPRSLPPKMPSSRLSLEAFRTLSSFRTADLLSPVK